MYHLSHVGEEDQRARPRPAVGTARERALAIGSAVITAHFLIQITGLRYTSATNTGWIISITPLVTVALSYVFLKEQISRFTIIGIRIGDQAGPAIQTVGSKANHKDHEDLKDSRNSIRLPRMG